MHDKEEIIRNLSNQYPVQVMRAFGNIDPASKAIEVIAKSLNEIYRYFEPSFYSGEFFVFKHLHDNSFFDDGSGMPLYDKNILLNRTNGQIIIQVFNDSSKMLLWENQDVSALITHSDILTYYFNNNNECFYANGSTIDLTIHQFGSRFATQFHDLAQALLQYWQTKILKSSCQHFVQSWSDSNRLFFRGGGSGNNIPEEYMQVSLYEFLNSFFARGITMDSSREYNLNGDFSKPKPVDVRINWREANRSALIEIKFIGTVKKDADGEIYEHANPRANKGITQLKGYHDAASTDAPTTIIKSFLVVIDGRRKDLQKNQTTISVSNGMFYKDVDIIIDADKKFHESIQGFEKAIRMFTEPICS